MKNILDKDFSNEESEFKSPDLMESKGFRLFLVLFVFYCVLFFITALGVWNSKISFGAGLGDVAYLIMYFLSLIPVGAYVGFKLITNKRYIILHFLVILYMLISIIYVGLSLTIWRGGEIPWNGNIFL